MAISFYRSHTRDNMHGSSTLPANFAKVKQIARRPRQPVSGTGGDSSFGRGDVVDDLHHNRHDVNEVGRLGAQSLLVNDAVHLVYGRRVISFMKPALFWLEFRGPDCHVIAEQCGGPDARPSCDEFGPRAGGCPPMA